MIGPSPDGGASEDPRLRSVWETLQTARRTHVVLLLATVAVMVAAAPFGPAVGKALEEIRVLREYPQTASFWRWCQDVAQKEYDEALAAARDLVQMPTLRWYGTRWIYCAVPAAEWAVERHLDFLTRRRVVQVVTADPEQVAAVLRAVERDDPPDRISIDLVDPPPRVRGRGYGWGYERPFEELEDRAGPRLRAEVFLTWPEWYRARGDEPWYASSVHRDTVPAVIETISTPRTPRRWLADEQPEIARIVIDSVFGEQRLLPALSESWEEVRTMSLDEAAQYLRGRGGGEGSVEVLGLRVDAEALAWGGPTALLFLLVYLQLHLQHLDRIGGDEVETFRLFPWFALFATGSARMTAGLTLWALPVAAGGLVTWRVVETGPITTVWAAGMTLLVASVGWRVLRELARVRGRVVEPGRPGPRRSEAETEPADATGAV